MIRYLPRFIALMVLFFAVAGISTYLTIHYVIQNEEAVVVPDLIGQDIIHGLSQLTDFGLNIKVKGSEYSREFPENHIIDQDPKPGEVIKKGRDVRLILSKGTQTLFMPNLKGLNLQQAALILDKNGLAEGNISKPFHETVKKNVIISQYPVPGKEIERGVPVDLLISMGPRPQEFVMPDLTGRFLDEAVLAAEKNNLVIALIKPVYQENSPENSIVSQEPLPGDQVLDGTAINLSVNRKTAEGQSDGDLKMKRSPLFRYRLPAGYLKQHIRIELRAFDTTFILHDALMRPETEIWVMVPDLSVSVIFVYKNNDLILSEIYD